MLKDRLAFFTSRTFFMGVTISYLFTLCGTSFWIADLLGTLLGVLMLVLIEKTNNNSIVKFITGFTLATISISVLVNMGHTLYLRETPVGYLTLFAAFGAIIISNSKKVPLIKIGNLLFIYSLILFFLKIIGLLPHIEMENLYPIMPLNINKVILGASVYMLVSVVPVLSLNDIDDIKNIIMTYITASITVILVSFLAISVLGYKEVQLYRYPEYVMLKKIEFLNFVNNVDNFFNFAIITDLLFTTSLGLKNIEESGKTLKYISITIITILTIFICNRCTVLLYIYDYLPYIFIFLLFMLLIPKK